MQYLKKKIKKCKCTQSWLWVPEESLGTALSGDMQKRAASLTPHLLFPHADIICSLQSEQIRHFTPVTKAGSITFFLSSFTKSVCVRNLAVELSDITESIL